MVLQFHTNQRKIKEDNDDSPISQCRPIQTYQRNYSKLTFQLILFPFASWFTEIGKSPLSYNFLKPKTS